MKTTLKGYGENAATFCLSGVAEKGIPVSMHSSMTVRACENGEDFMGCTLNVKGEYACVQLDGYVQFTYSGSIPSVGLNYIVADGNGGVRVAEAGRQYIVTDIDTENKKVGIIL